MLFILLLATFAAPAFAREEITAFAASVALSPDGSVAVTETIDVTAEGVAIRRGIFRDVFTTLVNEDRSRLRSTLDVVSVTRDGRAEPFVTESINNGVRIRIGDPDVFIPRGPHRYVIRYTMTRMARAFSDHDELFWNVTGNFWDFPILTSVATLTLPDGAHIDRLVGYTGRPGSLEQAVTATRVSDTTATFRTTRELRPGEGLSAAVSFEKGILVEPGGFQRWINFLSDHRDLILPAIAVALVLLYYTLAWTSVGRDPPRGTIVPLFHPPKGMSPSLMHYINAMGFRRGGWTAFTAAIFDLGVKGLLQLQTVGKELTIRVTGKQPEAPLPAAERMVFNYFDARGALTIDKETGPGLNKRRGEFVAAIEGENRLVYFRNNRVYSVLGAVLSLACLGVLVAAGAMPVELLLVSGFCGVFFALAASSLLNTVRGGALLPRLFGVLWVVVFGFNLLSTAGEFLSDLPIDANFIAAISIVSLNVLFVLLLRAPTLSGRNLMDQIEGFKMYLETAERERLNLRGEPPMTVKRFEAILPYAIAIGVEKPWTEHFEGELARNAVADAAGSSYSPGWYSGGGGAFSPGRISTTIGAAAGSVSAAMAAAQPSSSGGSGFSAGGGGSGGGGGGGGGGGW